MDTRERERERTLRVDSVKDSLYLCSNSFYDNTTLLLHLVRTRCHHLTTLEQEYKFLQ